MGWRLRSILGTGPAAGVPANPTYDALVLADGATGYWPLNDFLGTAAVASVGADGTYTGGYTLTKRGCQAFDPGTAVKFNGTTGYVDLGDHYPFLGTAAFTIELWVKVDSVTGDAFWVDKSLNVGGTTREGWNLGRTGNTVFFQRYANNVPDSVVTTDTIAVGGNYHVVATYDGATMRVYINNGTAATTASSLSLVANASHASIASFNAGNTYFASDTFQKVALYPTALADATVAAHYAAGTTWFSHGYPRVATIFSKTDENLAAGKVNIARHDLWATDPHWWGLNTGSGGVPASWSVGQYITSLNAKLRTIFYQHSCLTEQSFFTDWYGGETGQVTGGQTYYVHPRWLMCYAGTTLSGAVNNSTTTIPVTQLSSFTVGDYVLLGGTATQNDEVGLITGKSAASGAGNLTVTRGQFNQGGQYPAVTHAGGDWIRSIAWAFGQSVFVMDTTSNCPTATVAGASHTWNSWMAAWLAAKLDETLYTNMVGVFFDNWLDYAGWINAPTNVDRSRLNTATGLTDAQWKAGMGLLGAAVHGNAYLARLVMLGNTGGNDSVTFGAWLNGGMIEGVDENGANAGVTPDVKTFYLDWQTNGLTPKVFLFNAGSSTSPATTYATLRMNLAYCAIAGGYLVYDEFVNGGGHATEYWFDEYDDTGAADGTNTGWLGQPLAAYQTLAANVYARRFEGGTVIANLSASPVTVNLTPAGHHRIAGTQDGTTNSGVAVSSVTVPAKDGLVVVRVGGSTTVT